MREGRANPQVVYRMARRCRAFLRPWCAVLSIQVNSGRRASRGRGRRLRRGCATMRVSEAHERDEPHRRGRRVMAAPKLLCLPPELGRSIIGQEQLPLASKSSGVARR